MSTSELHWKKNSGAQWARTSSQPSNHRPSALPAELRQGDHVTETGAVVFLVSRKLT